MGNIVRVTARGKTRYKARWRTPEGESRSQVFDKYSEAERHIDRIKHDKTTGGYIDPRAGRITFKEYAETWRGNQLQHRPATAQHVEQVLNKHIYPVFGSKPLANITSSAVQGFVSDIAQRLAPATVRITYSYIVSVFRAAIQDRIVTATPCVGIKLPEVIRPQIKPLTPEEVDAMRQALPPRYQTLVFFMAYTGLRPSEAFAVTTDRINWLHGTLRIDRQLARNNHGVHFAPVKTRKKPVREIELPRQVIAALKEQVERFGPDPDSPEGKAGLVFVMDSGRPISHRRFYGSRSKPGIWHRARISVGLPEDVTLHDLRHFCASLLIARGRSVLEVQEQLGHASPTETLETYSHLFGDHRQRTRKTLEEAIDQIPTEDRPLRAVALG